MISSEVPSTQAPRWSPTEYTINIRSFFLQKRDRIVFLSLVIIALTLLIPLCNDFNMYYYHNENLHQPQELSHSAHGIDDASLLFEESMNEQLVVGKQQSSCFESKPVEETIRKPAQQDAESFPSTATSVLGSFSSINNTNKRVKSFVSSASPSSPSYNTTLMFSLEPIIQHLLIKYTFKLILYTALLGAYWKFHNVMNFIFRNVTTLRTTSQLPNPSMFISFLLKLSLSPRTILLLSETARCAGSTLWVMCVHLVLGKHSPAYLWILVYACLGSVAMEISHSEASSISTHSTTYITMSFMVSGDLFIMIYFLDHPLGECLSVAVSVLIIQVMTIELIDFMRNNSIAFVQKREVENLKRMIHLYKNLYMSAPDTFISCVYCPPTDQEVGLYRYENSCSEEALEDPLNYKKKCDENITTESFIQDDETQSRSNSSSLYDDPYQCLIHFKVIQYNHAACDMLGYQSDPVSNNTIPSTTISNTDSSGGAQNPSSMDAESLTLADLILNPNERSSEELKSAVLGGNDATIHELQLKSITRLRNILFDILDGSVHSASPYFHDRIIPLFILGKNGSIMTCSMSVSRIVLYDSPNAVSTSPHKPTASIYPVYYNMILHDLTQKYKLLDELNIEKEKAVQANNAKSQFLAQMSHELRTPLHGIIGLADVLLQSPTSAPPLASSFINNSTFINHSLSATPPSNAFYDTTSSTATESNRVFQKQYSVSPIETNQAQQQQYTQFINTLQTIKYSGYILLALINDLLDICKIESSKIQLECKTFNLRRALKHIHCGIFQHQAQQMNLNFNIDINPNVPTNVIGDENRLVQILINLVCNAIKFADQGSVSLSVEREEEEGMAQEGSNSNTAPENNVMSNSATAAGSPTSSIPPSENTISKSEYSISICNATPNIQESSQKEPPSSPALGTPHYYKIKFKVSYTGIDISHNDMCKLVRPFSQLHGSISRPGSTNDTLKMKKVNEGTRLGLYICKQLVELMGGELNVKSEKEKGSCFYFTVKLGMDESSNMSKDSSLQQHSSVQLPSTSQHMTEAPSLTKPANENLNIPGQLSKDVLSKLNILIVEDNSINRVVLINMLKKMGCQNIDSAKDGVEGCELYTSSTSQQDHNGSSKYDIAFIDLYMPRMNGYGVVQHILESESKETAVKTTSQSPQVQVEHQPRRHHTILVALTANGFEETRIHCLSNGFDIFMSKPFSMSDFSQCLAQCTKLMEKYNG